MDGRASSDDAERSAYLAECLRSEHCLVACGPGATDEHGVIGLTVLGHGHFFSRDFIDYLWVQAEHRREGIGSTLLQGVCCWGHEHQGLHLDEPVEPAHAGAAGRAGMAVQRPAPRAQ